MRRLLGEAGNMNGFEALQAKVINAENDLNNAERHLAYANKVWADTELTGKSQVMIKARRGVRNAKREMTNLQVICMHAVKNGFA